MKFPKTNNSVTQLAALQVLRQDTRNNPVMLMGGNIRPQQQLHQRTIRTNINFVSTIYLYLWTLDLQRQLACVTFHSQVSPHTSDLIASSIFATICMPTISSFVVRKGND